jgi:cytochrome c biogenesis factor
MKKKHLAILISQSVAIIVLIVYARVQQIKAQAAEREALAQFEASFQSRTEAEKQREMAGKAQMEAEKQKAMALASAEEARRQAEIAMRLSQKCK